MKKAYYFLPLAVLFLISITSAEAQKYRYEWDYYGLGFIVEGDFQVQQNDNTTFRSVSSDGEVSISVNPWIDPNVTVDHLYNATINLATQLNCYRGGPVEGDYIEIDDFDGYFLVTAPGDPNLYEYVIVALLLDIESDTNFQVTIGYTEGNLEEAIDMLLSFYAYDL